MSIKNNFLYYGVAIALFLGLKFLYTTASSNQVYFLIKPIDGIVSFFTNSVSHYHESDGFYHEKFNITIDKSCSGFNFLLMCFVILYTSLLRILKRNWHKLVVIPLTFLIAYLFTLFVNTSRILVAIFIEGNFNLHFSWMHQAQGVFIYLSFLIALYLFVNFLITKITRTHETYA